MDAHEQPAWFVGDLADPWSVEIARAVPGAVAATLEEMEAAGDAESDVPSAGVLVVHRGVLTWSDVERLSALRAKANGWRMVLCVGPYARHAELERWGSVFDVILPEATARETVARHVAVLKGQKEARPIAPRPCVGVLSGNYELRMTLAEACEAGGYPADLLDDWPAERRGGLVVWDVPVLDPDWPDVLAREASGSRIIGLFGFPDRDIVGEARTRGIWACLELPCDPVDLMHVLDRSHGRRSDLGHAVPAAPMAGRRSQGPVAQPSAGIYNETSPPGVSPPGVRYDSARESRRPPTL